MNNDVQVQLLIANGTEVSGNSIPYKTYTQTILHREQQKDIWQSTCNVSAGMQVQMNVLNSVTAVHTTYLTVLPYGRYYRLGLND